MQIVLDWEQVAGFFVLDQEASRLALGMQGIGGHHAVLDRHGSEQRAQGGDFGRSVG
ncbi:MAG: hypothetical protein ACRERU_05340 [Methylococcales bacterium]